MRGCPTTRDALKLDVTLAIASYNLMPVCGAIGGQLRHLIVLLGPRQRAGRSVAGDRNVGRASGKTSMIACTCSTGNKGQQCPVSHRPTRTVVPSPLHAGVPPHTSEDSVWTSSSSSVDAWPLAAAARQSPCLLGELLLHAHSRASRIQHADRRENPIRHYSLRCASRCRLYTACEVLRLPRRIASAKLKSCGYPSKRWEATGVLARAAVTSTAWS